MLMQAGEVVERKVATQRRECETDNEMQKTDGKREKKAVKAGKVGREEGKGVDEIWWNENDAPCCGKGCRCVLSKRL
jgi:hypothetical protein